MTVLRRSNIEEFMLKGQLISKSPFGVFKSSKKTSKKRSNQKSSVRKSK